MLTPEDLFCFLNVIFAFILSYKYINDIELVKPEEIYDE